MSNGDFDGAAERLYRAAGYKTTEQASLLALAERLLGDGTVRTVPAGILKSEGAIARVGVSWRIYLAAETPPHRRKFILAHELSHWALGPEASEDDCNRLAGALVLPRDAFLAELGAHTPRAGAARRFGVDQSCVWLRFGEVTGSPIALVAPTRVRVRGRQHVWPSGDLRLLAKGRLAPGLRRASLRDDQERVVLRVAT